MIRKGAALIMGLLIIVTLGTVALVVARQIISGLYLTSSLADAMVAESASKAGLEYGLLRYKNNPNITGDFRIHLDTNVINDPANLTINPPANERIADVRIGDVSGHYTIESIGRFGRVQKRHALVANFALAGGGGQLPSSVSLTPIQTDIDVYVNGGYADQNLDGAHLFVGYDTSIKRNMRTYIKFNNLPSELTGKTINNATLSLYMNTPHSSESDTQAIYKVIKVWDEKTITWNFQPESVPTDSSRTALSGEANGWKDWDITSLVQTWVDNPTSNEGLMIKSANEETVTTETERRFDSSDTYPDHSPQLKIIYTP